MPTDASEALHAILMAKGWSIAAAESLTVGRVQTYLGACSGSSAYFKGSICTYTPSRGRWPSSGSTGHMPRRATA